MRSESSDQVPGARRGGRRRRAFRGAMAALVIVMAGAVAARVGDEAAAAAEAAIVTLSDSIGSWSASVARGARKAILGEVRVGVQIGHLEASEHPDELARLRASTGGEAHGVSEVDINAWVAEALARILVRHGVRVDILPASVPPRYRADAFVSLHADSSHDPDRRGYKSAHFEPARTPQEAVLKRFIDEAYARHTRLPDDDLNVSGNMLHYYAFDARYRHSVAPTTPSILVEMGYITNLDDLAVLRDPELPARALAEGIVSYLRHVGRLPPEP